MSYYTANQTLYWDGSHLTASYTGLRALNPGDVVPDGEVTRDSLDTAGLVTLQTGGLPTRSGADVLEVWQSNRAYLQGQEILDPTGVTILVRKTSGTSRTTYDATEQALWSAAGTTTSGGSSLTPTAVKTANYTAAASDFVPVDTTSGNVTVTLPTAPADKTQVGVKHVVRGGTNTVTIAAGGTDKFNVAGGSTTASLALLREAATFQYVTATGLWYALSNDLPLSQLDLRYALAGASSAVTINPQTGTSYTLALTDAGGLVECTSAAAFTLTIPNDSTVVWPGGTVIFIGQGGLGQVTVAAGSGVTLRAPNGAKTALQFSQACLTKRAANDWVLSGDVTA